MRAFAFLVFATLAAGCDDHEDLPQPPPAPKPTSPDKLPKQLDFGDGTAFLAALDFGQCSGLVRGLQVKFGCQIYIYPYTLDLPGSAVVQTSTKGDEQRTISLLAAFGKLDVGTNLDSATLDPAATATIVFQNGKRLSGKLPAVKTTRRDIVEDLQALSAKGFRFSKTEPTPSKHSMLRLTPYAIEVLGPAKKFEDTDWIVVEDAAERETTKVCGGYEVDGSSKLQELPLWAEDVTVIVRHRATGEVLHSKKFESAMHCPSMAVGRLFARPSSDEMTKWLRSLL